MDGTGELFADFVAALPSWIKPNVVSYAGNTKLSYAQLSEIVRAKLPDSPFVLLAESFSSPLAVHLAAVLGDNLCGLVICAGFIESPIGTLASRILYQTAPVLFRLRPSSFLIRRWMVGGDVPPRLVQRVSNAISSAKPEVIAERMRAAVSCNAGQDLQALSVPILYLSGTEDRLIGDRGLKQFQRVRPETKVAKIRGPHLILQARPSEAALAVAQFMLQVL